MIRVPQDVSGRGPDRGALTIWGLAMIVIVTIIAAPVALYANGSLRNQVAVVVVSDKVADGVAEGADVKYRGLVVGRIESTEVTAQHGQRLTLGLDRAQAAQIRGTLTARFAPSNLFGVPGVELMTTGPGPALRDGATVTIDSPAAEVSTLTVLRDIGSITTTLTGDEVTAMINRLDIVVRDLAPLVSSGFELLTLAKSRQVMPLAEVLRISADTLRGADRMAEPFVDLFTTLVEKTEMYASEAETERVTGALTGLVQTFITLGQVVGTNPDDLATVLDASLTLGAPFGYTLSTVPSATDDARELIDRLERAFPKTDSGVRVRVGLTLDALPQITSALAASNRDSEGGR